MCQIHPGRWADTAWVALRSDVATKQALWWPSELAASCPDRLDWTPVATRATFYASKAGAVR